VDVSRKTLDHLTAEGFLSSCTSRLALTDPLRECKAAGFWKPVSRVFVENAASRRLLRELRFRGVEVYEKHGLLDGVRRDVVIVECLLTNNLITTP
jgi:L-amino acid N-acyltransferase YncA